MMRGFIFFLFACANCFASEYCLVLLTDARQLDYRCNQSFFRSMTKHPSDGSKNGDVGHAWIYLHGKKEGKCIYLEGGHSGETRKLQPSYFDGVLLLCQQNDPNPVRYLWAIQKDGFFQEGSGGHRPTYAAKIDLSEEQFQEILHFVDHYDFGNYAIAGNQCTTFLVNVAAIAGLELDHRQKMTIDPFLQIGRQRVRLWSDPGYSTIVFSSPDVVEASLKKAVSEGRASDALEWYRKKMPRPKRNIFREAAFFPERLYRHYLFKD